MFIKGRGSLVEPDEEDDEEPDLKKKKELAASATCRPEEGESGESQKESTWKEQCPRAPGSTDTSLIRAFLF